MAGGKRREFSPILTEMLEYSFLLPVYKINCQNLSRIAIGIVENNVAHFP